MFVLLMVFLGILLFASGAFVGTKYKLIVEALEELRGRNDSSPPLIVKNGPGVVHASTEPDEGGTIIVTTKTPQQFEKEDKENVDRMGGIDG